MAVDKTTHNGFSSPKCNGVYIYIVFCVMSFLLRVGILTINFFLQYEASV